MSSEIKLLNYGINSEIFALLFLFFFMSTTFVTDKNMLGLKYD